MNILKGIFNLKKVFTLVLCIIFIGLNAQKKFTIVLDAGHGGKDTGTKTYYSDLGMVNEKDVTLAVTLKLGKLLEQNKDIKVIYTRTADVYPTLGDRTDLANRVKASLFISLHCNGAGARKAPYGTETFVQGPDQNDTNLEVAKRENDVIYLDSEDRKKFSSYDPKSPESLIALKLQQSKYLEASLLFGSYVEDNFVNNDHRLSRGVKQKNLHVLRLNAMPSVLIEMGFISNPTEAHYLVSENGQNEIAKSIYEAIIKYKNVVEKKETRNSSFNSANNTPTKPKEQPLKNDYRVLLMSTPERFNTNDVALKGLNYIFVMKENDLYKYYYGTTNLASIRDNNVKTAKGAGFRNAVAIGFMPNQSLANGYYTLELIVTEKKLGSDSFILNLLNGVKRTKKHGKFYYTYGNFKKIEDAIDTMKTLSKKGINNIVIEKVE